MPTIELPQGKVEYRVAGPDDSASPPVVFVHGFLVSATLWTKTADALAAAGIRSYAPDWPLGSHRMALDESADQTPRGVARHVLSFLEALDLKDVTLVGNDSGGAISQFVIDTDSARIGRLVLTNCDAFDKFPPPPFDFLFKSFKKAGAIKPLLAPMKAASVRHSPAGFGLLAKNPFDAEQTRAWVDPCLTDADVRRDTAAFVRAVDDTDLMDVSSRQKDFPGPVLLVWGNADRFFKIDLGRRLETSFSNARLVEVEGGKTFIPLDFPERLAEEIGAFIAESSAKAGATG